MNLLQYFVNDIEISTLSPRKVPHLTINVKVIQTAQLRAEKKFLDLRKNKQSKIDWGTRVKKIGV